MDDGADLRALRRPRYAAGRPFLVLARRAAATAHEPQDYPAFWAYALALAREVHQNGLAVAFCGICLPEQLGAAEPHGFTGVEVLALTCADDLLRERLRARAGGEDVATRADRHVALNARLRGARSTPGLRVRQVDTSRLDPAGTGAAAVAWAREVVGSATR